MKQAAAVLAALTLLRLAVAASLPLIPDETYYWLWSRALAPGYVDHPPMVALWIRAGTILFGQTALGVRLLGPLSAALSSVLLADAAERLFPGRRAWLTAGLLWNATLLVGAGSVLMTPDAPLLFFWCGALWAMARLATGGSGLWWLAAGISAGAALASKYTAGFLWGGIGLWALVVPSSRRWLLRPWPWIGALAGAAVFLPVVLWNAQHDWVSFLRQGGRLGDWQSGRALSFLAELVGGQIGLATPGVWLLCVVGIWIAMRAWREREPRSTLFVTLSLPAAIVFTEHALGDRVQGNWPAIIYPAAVLAAAGLTPLIWRRLVWPSAWCGFALTALVLLHATTGVLPVPPKADPIARQAVGWDRLTSRLEAERIAAGGTFVIAEQYSLIAELAWNAPSGMRVAGVEPRLAPLGLEQADLSAEQGILIRPERRGGDIAPAVWPNSVPIGFIDRENRRGTIERYRIWRVSGPVNATIVPRP